MSKRFPLGSEVIITSTTDTPASVAAAMGAEIETETESGGEGDAAAGTGTEGAKDGEKPNQKEGKAGAKEGDEGTGTSSESGDADADADGAGDGDGDGGEDEGVESKAKEGEEQKPKKKGGFQKKISRLQQENDLLLDLLKKQQKGKDGDDDATPTPTTDDGKDAKTKTFSGKPKPKLADFSDADDPYAAHAEALSDFAVDEAYAKLKFEQGKNTQETRATEAQTAFQSRHKVVTGDDGIYSDYDELLETVKEDNLPVTGLMQQLIMSAKNKAGDSISVDVMHYLASNPDVCREIASLDPAEQAAEMGVIRQAAWAETTKRLEAKGSKAKDGEGGKGAGAGSKAKAGSDAGNGAGSASKPKPKAPPAPITPVGKRSAPASKDLETVAASGDFKAYEAERLKQGRVYR